MTLTTGEAATIAGVEPATIRSWVMKGWLVPVPRLDPRRRHHLFMPDAVIACEYAHRSSAKRANLRRAQAEWVRMVDNSGNV